MWAVDLFVLGLAVFGFGVALAGLFRMTRRTVMVHLPQRRYGLVAAAILGLVLGVVLGLTR